MRTRSDRETTGAIVCIVDDDASLRRSVSNLLRSVGFRVQTFASAEEFLQLRDVEATKCLVLDVRLPGMSGLDLLLRLRDSGSLVGIVMLTAHDDDQVRQRALATGAVAFLAKPFRANDLVTIVKACLERGA